jgi:hypothetical protein
MLDTLWATQLINAALTHLGQAHVTLPSELPAAGMMYPLVRDKLLSWARWRFATVRTTLSQLATAPAFGYDYQYALPTNPLCLRILDVSCRDYEYAIETYPNPLDPATQQRVLLTDHTSVGIRYIGRVSEAVWPPLVQDTCALWLACAISQDVTGKAALRSQLFQELQVQLDRAILLEGHQDTHRRILFHDAYIVARDTDWIPQVDPSLPTP